MGEMRDPLTHEIIGAAIEVHSYFGPGLLEHAFEECFWTELSDRGLAVERQVPMPLIYKNRKTTVGYRIDLIIENQVIVELKSVEKLTKVHDAQILTYMKVSGLPKGLLINIMSQPLIDGIKRFVL